MKIYEISDNIKWKLEEYTSAMGRKAITDWRQKRLTVGRPRAYMDKFLKDRVKELKWSSPFIEGLRGENYRGLSELRWRCGKPHRIIGYSSMAPKIDGLAASQHAGIFVMLIGCKHDGRKYDPTDCFDTAVERKREIEQGKATTSEYILPFNR